MKFVDSVRQEYGGTGGILETWILDNGLYIKFWKDLDGKIRSEYEVSLSNKNGVYTKSIYDIVNHESYRIPMEYVGLFPAKIKFNHKYFDKFISIVENFNVNDLTPDPFQG